MTVRLPRFQREQGSVSDGGFRTLGDFLVAVHRAANRIEVDKRLRGSSASENDPTAGGFIVPELYASDVIGSIYEEAMLAPLCDVTELAGPLASIKEPAFDETSRLDGSRWGGSLGYWESESENITASKPKFRLNEFTPHKIALLSYVTSELFSDSNMLASHFERAMKSEGAFKLDAAIFNGTGAGVALGIVNSPCTISIAKESGQAVATIVDANVRKMWSRLPIASRKRAVWLVNEDAEEQLDQLAAPLYMPQGTGGNPYPLLKGRPVLAIEQALPTGSVGDIVLADLSTYRVVQGAPRFALSADVAFLTDELAFRFTFRVDGKPAYASAVTPFNGSGNTRSPFVTLAAR